MSLGLAIVYGCETSHNFYVFPFLLSKAVSDRAHTLSMICTRSDCHSLKCVLRTTVRYQYTLSWNHGIDYIVACTILVYDLHVFERN